MHSALYEADHEAFRATVREFLAEEVVPHHAAWEAAGVAGFVARADELADAYGERFRPPAILLEQAVPAGSLRAAVG